MKVISCLFFLFSSIVCIGQSADIEALINVAYKEIVPQTFVYFNLVDSSFVMKFDKYKMDYREMEHKAFFKVNPEFNVSEFVALSLHAKKINWKNYSIENAAIYSYDSIPKFPEQVRITRYVTYDIQANLLDSLQKAKKYDEIIVPVKKFWGKKKIKEATETAWKEYENNVKLENTLYFRFSTPLISTDKKYAVIELYTSGRGAYYIFKKVNGKWEFAYVFGRFVS